MLDGKQMSRRFGFATVAIIALSFMLAAWRQSPYGRIRSITPTVPHHITLSWETSPSNSQAVTWRTDGQTQESHLEFCEATPSPFFDKRKVRSIKATSSPNQADDGLWHHHSVNMERLKSSTVYSYRVGKEGAWSEWSEFQTGSGDSEPFSFIYFGDVQRDIHSLGSRILRQAVRNKPQAKFLLFGGDMVHRGALNRENWTEFFSAGSHIFQNYPMISTPGNHEHNNAKSGIDLSDNWYLNFTFPRNGPPGHEEETFFIDYNNVRIISLNLCRYRFPEDRSVMLSWFEDRLREYEGDWIFVVHHYAMISCKAHKEKPPIRFPEFKALYERYHVPMILMGHEHVYARGRVGNKFPVYVVSVAGPHQNGFYFDDWIERAGISLQLYQEINITPEAIHYVSKTVLGDVYDEFTIRKDANDMPVFTLHDGLPPESLIPPSGFEERYDREIVESFDVDRDRYLKRTKPRK